MKKRLLQAYKQSPWRVQLQWIGLFLLAVLLVATITGLYLSVSAQAAAAGRNVQWLENDIEETTSEISDLMTKLAKAQSTEKMAARAEELGFHLLDPENAIYIEVPGFDPDSAVVLAPPRSNTVINTPLIQDSYTSSLWDWFTTNIWMGSSAASGGGN
jgi:cell division protein FtsL